MYVTAVTPGTVSLSWQFQKLILFHLRVHDQEIPWAGRARVVPTLLQRLWAQTHVFRAATDDSRQHYL